MKLSLFRILLVPLAICLLAGAALAADPTGTWQWTTTNKEGKTTQYTGKFQLQGGSLVGQVSTPRGQWRIESATFTGTSIVFTVSYSAKATARYSGTLFGDTISGRIIVSGSKGTVTKDWSARRDQYAAPPPAP
jgi:hypothetical protein